MYRFAGLAIFISQMMHCMEKQVAPLRLTNIAVKEGDEVSVFMLGKCLILKSQYLSRSLNLTR
jgi:catabolite regulation protein CreA